MSEVIGSNTVYSTWAVLRSPLGLGSPYAGGTVKSDYGHNVEYDHGFVTTENTLLPIPTVYYSQDNPPPRFVYEDTGTTPTSTAGMFYMWGLLYDGNLLQEWIYDQLNGQTVTMTGGSFSISTDAWTVPPSYQTVSGGLGTVTSIGALTYF